jgi:hypothetical protein
MVRVVGRLRLAWLPDEPVSEQHVELCAGDEVTWYAFGDKRLELRQVEDPDRDWARGRGGVRWRQRTVEGRRLDWRVEEGRMVVFQRIGDVAAWVTASGFAPEDVLRAAASLPGE